MRRYKTTLGIFHVDLVTKYTVRVSLKEETGALENRQEEKAETAWTRHKSQRSFHLHHKCYYSRQKSYRQNWLTTPLRGRTFTETQVQPKHVERCF